MLHDVRIYATNTSTSGAPRFTARRATRQRANSLRHVRNKRLRTTLNKSIVALLPSVSRSTLSALPVSLNDCVDDEAKPTTTRGHAKRQSCTHDKRATSALPLVHVPPHDATESGARKRARVSFHT